MTQEFYGATLKAQHSISKLLSLSASGREQDWEFELTDPHRIEEMLAAASITDLDYDEKCALALITIASIEEFVEEGVTNSNLIEQAKVILKKDSNVCKAMKFYWIEQGREKAF
jgi:hypothetical protein